MADFYVRNSLSLTKAVKFNITLRYFVIKSTEGDHVWTLEIGTTYPDISGNPISAKIIHKISVNNLDQAIEGALSSLCAQIDWSPLVQDKEAPYVYLATPEDGSIDASVFSSILVILRDFLPSAGIDLSNMKVILNNSMTDFDITGELEITGDPYEYEFRWAPTIRVQDTYD